MSDFFGSVDDHNTDYEGFYDGQNEVIPDNEVLDIMVTDGFYGMEEGKSLMVCIVNFTITTPGKYFGDKHKYSAKLWDNDAAKRDTAKANLGVLDAQAGFPMTTHKLSPSTENIHAHWVGKAQARVKFGLFVTAEDANGDKMFDANGEPVVKTINFVRGFGYLRDKMIKQGGQPQQVQQPAEQQAPQVADDDIDF